MKRKHLIAIGAIIVTISAITMFQSCSKIGSLLNFTLNMQTESFTVTIPPSGTSGTFTVAPTTTEYNVDSFIKAETANQLGIANIKSVKLSSVVFTLNNADSTNNFQNFQALSASFTSNTDATPYDISISDNPNTYATTLSLPIDTTAQLASYIGTTFSYNVSGSLRAPTTIPLNCTITVTFSVNVQG